MSTIFEEIQEAIEDGEVEDAEELVRDALEDGQSPRDIIDEGLIEGMNTVDERFQEGDLFMPEVLRSAKAMEAGMGALKPYLEGEGQETLGKILFCTVLGDIHDVGKKMCIMMLQNAGYEVIDLGVDVGVEQIIEGVRAYHPDILALSAMLSTTMVTLEDTAAALAENNLQKEVKLIVGGAPVSGDYAEGIGASYSSDAIEVVALVNHLLEN